MVPAIWRYRLSSIVRRAGVRFRRATAEGSRSATGPQNQNRNLNVRPLSGRSRVGLDDGVWVSIACDIDDAVAALSVTLTDDEAKRLQAPYTSRVDGQAITDPVALRRVMDAATGFKSSVLPDVRGGCLADARKDAVSEAYMHAHFWDGVGDRSRALPATRRRSAASYPREHG